MARYEQHPRLFRESRLRPVPVVDIEIEDGDPLQAMRRQRMGGADGGVVEETEPHRPVGFGVVPRRAHGAERPPRGGAEDRVHRRARRPGGPQRGLPRTGRDDGIAVDMRVAFAGNCGEHALHRRRRVDPPDLGARSARRCAAVERGEPRRRQGALDRAQALRAFGVARPRVVAGAGGMREDGESLHGGATFLYVCPVLQALGNAADMNGDPFRLLVARRGVAGGRTFPISTQTDRLP